MQFYGYTSLFHGVRLNDLGALDLESLHINLRQLTDVQDPDAYARRALGDFVRFAVVALRGYFTQKRRSFDDEIRRLTHGH